jgi:hypothetical protein
VSRWKRPLTAREVRRILKNLRFVHRNTEGGHENWVRHDPPPFRKVTLDAHLEPFADTLIRYMASQAGVTVRQFYQAL